MPSVLERRLRRTQLFAAVQLGALATLPFIQPADPLGLRQLVFVAALLLALVAVALLLTPTANRLSGSRPTSPRVYPDGSSTQASGPYPSRRPAPRPCWSTGESLRFSIPAWPDIRSPPSPRCSPPSSSPAPPHPHMHSSRPSTSSWTCSRCSFGPGPIHRSGRTGEATRAVIMHGRRVPPIATGQGSR